MEWTCALCHPCVACTWGRLHLKVNFTVVSVWFVDSDSTITLLLITVQVCIVRVCIFSAALHLDTFNTHEYSSMSPSCIVSLFLPSALMSTANVTVSSGYQLLLIQYGRFLFLIFLELQ